MKKVLVLLADGFEEIEALTVVDVLRRGNVDCKICSIEDEDVRGTHDIIIKSDCNINEINSEEYDAVVLPGGLPGADNLKADCVKELVIKMNDKNKIVAAICAAPGTLEYFNILEPKFPKWLNEYINTKEMLKQQYISVTCGTIYSDLFKNYCYSIYSF